MGPRGTKGRAQGGRSDAGGGNTGQKGARLGSENISLDLRGSARISFSRWGTAADLGRMALPRPHAEIAMCVPIVEAYKTLAEHGTHIEQSGPKFVALQRMFEYLRLEV
jgi:hypothetical protein